MDPHRSDLRSLARPPYTQEMVRRPADLIEHRGELVRCYEALGRAGWPSLNPLELELDRCDPAGLAAFDVWLSALDVRHFSAVRKGGPGELAKAHHPKKAKKLGYPFFVPPSFTWPWCGAVLLIADQCRDIVGRPVKIRNLWRPWSYNLEVAESAINSDHPNACAGDLDFRSSGDRRAIEPFLRRLDHACPALQLSVGYAKKSLHVGVRSPKGRRWWFYRSYPDKRVGLG